MQHTVQYERWPYAPSRFANCQHTEEESSCPACLCLLHFRTPVRCRRAPPCTMESSLLLCLLFLPVETPTTAIWPAFPLQCAAILWFKRDGRSNATAVHFPYRARCDSRVPRPPFQADSGTDGEPFPCISRCTCETRSSNIGTMLVQHSCTRPVLL